MMELGNLSLFLFCYLSFSVFSSAPKQNVCSVQPEQHRRRPVRRLAGRSNNTRTDLRTRSPLAAAEPIFRHPIFSGGFLFKFRRAPGTVFDTTSCVILNNSAAVTVVRFEERAFRVKRSCSSSCSCSDRYGASRSPDHGVHFLTPTPVASVEKIALP
ncbi:hypothetical protein MRX96_039357 [Rhipicephalus microplus]